MSRSRLVLAAAFAITLCAPAASLARELGDGPIGSWYVGVRQGIVATNRELRHDGDITSVQFGRRLGEGYELEVELTQDRLDFGIDYGLKHRSAQINLLLVNREPLWDPYFLIGVGASRYDSPVGERKGTDGLVAFAIGGTWDLLASRRLQLRADLRIRYDLDDTGQPEEDSRGDGIFTIGLLVPFGTPR